LANLGGGEEAVDSCTRTEIESGLALLQVRERQRVAAADSQISGSTRLHEVGVAVAVLGGVNGNAAGRLVGGGGAVGGAHELLVVHGGRHGGRLGDGGGYGRGGAGVARESGEDSRRAGDVYLERKRKIQ